MKKANIQGIREEKTKDSNYLYELQKFLDTAENIEDIEFKNRIIGQMLKCDEALTKLIEKIVEE